MTGRVEVLAFVMVIGTVSIATSASRDGFAPTVIVKILVSETMILARTVEHVNGTETFSSAAIAQLVGKEHFAKSRILHQIIVVHAIRSHA